MRRLLLIAWCLAITHIGIAQSRVAPTVPEDSVRALCEYMVRTYPQSTLQDLYKTCYQDFFGAEHMIRDTASVRRYLHFEIEHCAAEDMSLMPVNEPTGFRHRFVRINLRLVLDGQMTEDELFEAFLHAANTSTPAHADWYAEWCQIEQIALQIYPEWQNEELQAALRQAASDNQAVHHSDAFREAYHPHYRIVTNK